MTYCGKCDIVVLEGGVDVNRFKYIPIQYFENNKQWIFKFENGYGASVISGYWAKGNEFSPYELGVIWFVDTNWHLDYTTPITDDVIGYQTLDEINELLDKIKAL